MNAIELLPTGTLSQDARRLLGLSKADATLRAYRSDWKGFNEWCSGNGLSSLPAAPETVANYIAALSFTHKPASIKRKKVSISEIHKHAHYPDPLCNAVCTGVWDGIKRSVGVKTQKKDALRLDDLERIIDRLPDSVQGARDRAFLTLGFAGAFRESELVALNIEDLEWHEEGLVVHVQRSKRDQEGRGASVVIPYGDTAKRTCAVRSVGAWVQILGVKNGPLWRRVGKWDTPENTRLSVRGVDIIIKRACERVGLDPKRFAGHSLRSGFATQAAKMKVEEWAIAAHMRHKDPRSTRGYIQAAKDPFEGAAAGKIGL